MQSKPYHNDQIIAVIHDVYFTNNGGKSPFATRYKYLFQQTKDDGETTYEVPIPLVALVATALYVTLHEWHTGNQQVMEFSMNTYLDVYQGHINTLQLIWDGQYGAFHSMMVEIYSKASCVPKNTEDVGAPVAVLDLSDLGK
ncbi:hypothetical protein EI94DRAFT_1700100 [Lactarius quietus]|nr:hypothetical protein EI94DRAFT_1700100 [Lactarius quietus]